MFTRITTATLALLVAVGAITLFFRDLNEGVTSMAAAAATIGVVSLLSGFGQISGVMRLVTGLSEGDSLWARIRSRFVQR